MSTNENIKKERIRKIFAVLTTMYNSTRQGLTHLSICKIIMDANLTSPWVSDLPISMLKHGLVEKQSISNNTDGGGWMRTTCHH